MTTTLSIDKEIRDLAAKKAKQDKLSVSAVARMLLKDYADGKIEIGSNIVRDVVVDEVDVDADTQDLMDSVVSSWRKTK
jgi:hypothetical protein